MSDYYIEVDGVPKPVSVLEWARWFEQAGRDRIVRKTKTNHADVSTVFLGLDHQFVPGGPPLLYETLVFGGRLDQEMVRYSTRHEATVGHWHMVEEVRRAEQWWWRMWNWIRRRMP